MSGELPGQVISLEVAVLTIGVMIRRACVLDWLLLLGLGKLPRPTGEGELPAFVVVGELVRARGVAAVVFLSSRIQTA